VSAQPQRIKPFTPAWYVPSTHNFPNIRVTYYNTRSLSAYATKNSGRIRKKRLIRNFEAILNYSHILCLQETHLLPLDDFSLKDHFTNYNIYYSNGNGWGGVCIISHKSLRNFYDITPFDLGKDAIGRVQGIRYDPIRNRNNKQVAPFNVLNWHFEGDKIAQMSFLINP
jgi:exonuclease III